jgi:hypothetical protein
MYWLVRPVLAARNTQGQNMKHLMLAAALMCAPLAAGAATISGAFYDVGGRTNFSNVNSNDGVGAGIGAAETASAALNYIASNAANATFTSSGISYNMTTPNYNMPASIGAFLGADASTLSGGASTPFLGSILVFTGAMKLLAGNNVFDIFSDDGFILEIDGVEEERFEGLRAPGSSVFNVASSGGIKNFRLIYFEGSQSQAALQAKVNGQILVAAVPLPAAGLMLIGAIGGLVALRRRKLAA